MRRILCTFLASSLIAVTGPARSLHAAPDARAAEVPLAVVGPEGDVPEDRLEGDVPEDRSDATPVPSSASLRTCSRGPWTTMRLSRAVRSRDCGRFFTIDRGDMSAPRSGAMAREAKWYTRGSKLPATSQA